MTYKNGSIQSPTQLVKRFFGSGPRFHQQGQAQALHSGRVNLGVAIWPITQRATVLQEFGEGY